MSQAQRVVIALLTCLVLWCAWQSRLSSQTSASNLNDGRKTQNIDTPPKQHDRWWERAKDPISVFTFCLVAVGVFQICLFYWQLKLIRESLNDAKVASNAAALAAAASDRQAKIAEDSLIKIERPYLFIFNVSRLDISILDESDDVSLSVTYSVANYGKIPAIIKYAQGVFEIGASPPLPSHLPDSHTLVASPILAPGETRPTVEAGFYWMGGTEYDEYGDTIPTIPKGSSLFLWIILTYRGPFTDQHETRACWIYNESTRRFVGPWGGPDYSSQK